MRPLLPRLLTAVISGHPVGPGRAAAFPGLYKHGWQMTQLHGASRETGVTGVTPGEFIATVDPFLTSTALVMPEGAQLTLEAAIGMLRELQQVDTGASLWCGDFWLWLERTYGDDFRNAMSDEDYNRARPYIWVAERCPPEIRIPGLTFSHYRAVGGLKSLVERENLLLQSSNENWSVARLKEAITGEPKSRKKLDKAGILDLSQSRIGQTWTADDDLQLRAGLGE